MNSRTALVLAAALGFAAAAPAQTVNVARNADIRSLNPGVNRDDNTDAVMLHMVEGLVAMRENGSVGPLLAENVALAKDGVTYTFTLRKGVKFHNGAPLTAADVLWSWNRYMDPKTDWRCLSEFDGRNGLKVESVTAPNPQTVVMRINKPNGLFLDTLARPDCAGAGVIHKDSLNADGSFKAPVGTGPFKLDEWKRGEYVKLSKFAGYVSPAGKDTDGYTGAKRPLVDAVKFMVIPDPATTKAAIVSGAIDTAEMLDSDLLDLQKAPNVDVQTTTNGVKEVILFQTRDPVMGKQKIREAISHALDLRQLVPAVTSGLAKPNPSVIHTGSPFYDETQKQGYRYDPALARKLLQEAGYKGEVIKMITNKRAARPSFNIALISQQMMQAVGLNVEIEVLEWATQLDRYNKGNYQMMAFSYSARLDPALSYEQFSGPKDKQPRKVWENPQALALIEKASASSDEAERRRIFDELHKSFQQDIPMLMLFNEVQVNAVSRRMQGFRPWVATKPRLWEVKVTR
ncbi:ABC transporter substrate-binding protein [Ramlibacter sp. G-1-2-2]|uniref:ABC transporter substrate-binding protein n=1 Tax=Ramlibacter agri TaxID=2728837 RepID=A0A848HA01_9BURK|nr:ABC transporter substrate-binding protein [Ramlibacter agri]NML47314.1 ABC transporter substrate-binding protein [Ramlibacter agri]